MAIRQITIVGTGLIGGSLGLALKQAGFDGAVVGCDKRAVLETAQFRGAIDRAEADLERAIVGSDVVVLATPVGCILSQLEVIATQVPPTTLITDAGSTKLRLVERAQELFGETASQRFLPGHPMAGKEVGGIDNADASLFRDAVWLISPVDSNAPASERQDEYLALLRSIGSRIISMEPERHDRLCAWISHLPQMMATALACTLREELGDDEAVSQIGGRALREMTRIAHSPYSMWRDIALTNSENLEDALSRYEQQLAHLRENLRGPGLREMFEEANQWSVAGGQLPVVRGVLKDIKEGERVRIIRVPDAVHDSEHFKTRSSLEQCIGRIFPVMGVNKYGLLQIDVGEVDGKPGYMASIWIEPECVELVLDKTDN
jgi:prephenate dehydrogenase